MSSHLRLANEAWEAYYRAHATLPREFADADIWNGVDTSEYTVLPVLSTNPIGVSITELGRNLVLSQPSVSRLVARMESRGLLRRGRIQRMVVSGGSISPISDVTCSSASAGAWRGVSITPWPARSTLRRWSRSVI